MAYVESLLAEGEILLRSQRQHPLALLKRSLGALVGILVALVLVAGAVVLDGGVGSLLGLLAAAVALVAVVAFGWAYLRWSSDLDILTSRRVIQVEGVMNKAVLDSALEQINDALLTQTWVGRLLGYGTLEVLTASEAGISTMTYLRDPAGFKRAMVEAKEALARERLAGLSAGPATPMPSGALEGSGRPADGASPSPTAARLLELEDLRRRGLISDDEYWDKRREILSGL